MTKRNLVDELNAAYAEEKLIEIHVETATAIIRNCFIPEGIEQSGDVIEIRLGNQIIDIYNCDAAIYENGTYTIPSSETKTYICIHAA